VVLGDPAGGRAHHRTVFRVHRACRLVRVSPRALEVVGLLQPLDHPIAMIRAKTPSAEMNHETDNRRPPTSALVV
jgi:hypothetical protein